MHPHHILESQITLPKGPKNQEDTSSTPETREEFHQHVLSAKYFWESTEEVTKDTKSQFPLFRKCEGWQWRMVYQLSRNRKACLDVQCRYLLWPVSVKVDMGRDARMWLLRACLSQSVTLLSILGNQPKCGSKWPLNWMWSVNRRPGGDGCQLLDPSHCWDPQFPGAPVLGVQKQVSLRTGTEGLLIQ